MKKILICLNMLIWAMAVCFAQNALWAGNAARGNDDAYPASIRSSGKAAGMSLALPEGTLVQVKNQKNGNTADVTIVSGQGKPGIFLLLNSTASDALDIHAGEVIMVEIQEKSSRSNPFLDYSADPDAFKKSLTEEFLTTPEEDPDNAASVDVEEEMSKMGYSASETDGENSEVPTEEAMDEPVAEEMSESEMIIAPEEESLNETVPEEVSLPEEDVSEVVSVEETDTSEPEIEVVPAEPEPVEEIIIIPDTEVDEGFEEVVIADSETTFDAELDYREEGEEAEEVEATPFLTDEINIDELAAAEESTPVEESAAEPETSIEESAAEPETSIEEPAEEPETPAEGIDLPVIDPDRVIYFLTPAELRPPEPVEEEEPVLPAWEDSEEVLTIETTSEDVPEEEISESVKEEPEVLFVPQYVEAEELEAYMNESLETGSRYVQVASFGKENTDEVYSNMVNLQDAFPYLPIMLLPGNGESSLRLMAGPVSRDEVGILLYAMKAHGFSEAFLSRE